MAKMAGLYTMRSGELGEPVSWRSLGWRVCEKSVGGGAKSLLREPGGQQALCYANRHHS